MQPNIRNKIDYKKTGMDYGSGDVECFLFLPYVQSITEFSKEKNKEDRALKCKCEQILTQCNIHYI